MGGTFVSASTWTILADSWLSRTAWGVGITLVTFVISLAVVTIVIVRLPAAHFARPPQWRDDRSPAVRWTLRILKNLLGVVVVAAGIAMLFLPGQGILTILIGVMLLDFPGKQRLERTLVGRPRILSTINRVRARFGKPPLILEEGPESAAEGGPE